MSQAAIDTVRHVGTAMQIIAFHPRGRRTLQRMGGRWLVVLFAVGCYHPTLQFDVPCTTEGECPSGQTCVSDRCVANGAQSDGAVQLDARVEGNQPDAAIDAPSDAAPPPMILFKSERDAAVPAAMPAMAIVIPHPACPTGGVMIAAVAVGNSGAAALPTITAPAGWALVRRLDHLLGSTLAVYVHVAGGIEPAQHSWAFTTSVEGVAWIACYANVDTTNPIIDEAGVVIETNTTVYAFPSVAPNVANSMLVGIVSGHNSATPTTWTPPTGMTERVDVNDATTRSGTGIDRLDPGTGATTSVNATASQIQDYALLEILALRPKP